MRFAISSAFLFCSTMAHGAIVNGDFDDDLNGYTLEACAFLCNRSPDPFFEIQSNGANSYLGVTTGTSLLGVTQASASMDIQITSNTNLLSFDAIQFSTQNDPGSSGTGNFFSDALSVVLIDEGSAFHFAFDIVSSGANFNPFSNANLSVTQTTASDAFFDTGVEVDLSAFDGQTLSLGIFAFSESDGDVLFGGFDNFALTGNPISAVPLPASLPLLIGAFGILGLTRRRQQG